MHICMRKVPKRDDSSHRYSTCTMCRRCAARLPRVAFHHGKASVPRNEYSTGPFSAVTVTGQVGDSHVEQYEQLSPSSPSGSCGVRRICYWRPGVELACACEHSVYPRIGACSGTNCLVSWIDAKAMAADSRAFSSMKSSWAVELSHSGSLA